MPPSCNGLTSFEGLSPFPWQYHPQMRKKEKELLCGSPVYSSSFGGWGERARALWGRVRLCHLCHSLSFDPLGVGYNLVGLHKANRHFPALWLAKQLNTLPTAGAGAEGGGPSPVREDLRSPSQPWEAQALLPFADCTFLPFLSSLLLCMGPVV